MFQIKATRGNVNLSVFDLAELTNKANQTAQEIAEHNAKVQSKFRELVIDYITNLNSILSDLGLRGFENVNKQFGEHYISFFRDGLGAAYSVGVGDGCKSIRITFNTPMQGEKLTYDFNGVIRIYKAWKEVNGNTIRKSEEHKLESVEQVLEVGAGVIKVMIIDRDVENLAQRQELFNLINY